MSARAGARTFAPDALIIRELVQAAVLAPSADNQHHFQVSWDGRGITMHADREFVDCAAPHRRLLILVSYGAVVENLRLRMTEHGFSFRPRWFPDDSDRSTVLRLRWDKVQPVERADPLATFIAARHTNRRFFKGPALTTAERAAVDGVVDGTELVWFVGDDRKRLLHIMRTAETARFATEALHRELFGSIRFDVDWRGTTAERLAPGSLEVEAPLRPIFKVLRHWRLMRAANVFGAHHTFGFRAGDLPARTAPHLCAITSKLPLDEAALAAGTTFQRVWLAAESQGLALQPMVASSILSIISDTREGLPLPKFEALRERWTALIGAATPIIVFRLGRATRPALRSGRRPVDDYLR